MYIHIYIYICIRCVSTRTSSVLTHTVCPVRRGAGTGTAAIQYTTYSSNSSNNGNAATTTTTTTTSTTSTTTNTSNNHNNENN